MNSIPARFIVTQVVHLLTLVALLNVAVQSSSWSHSICLVTLQMKKTLKG
jgi:hypothetical protein